MRDRFNDVKVVLIVAAPSDRLEVIANTVCKNGLDPKENMFNEKWDAETKELYSNMRSAVDSGKDVPEEILRKFFKNFAMVRQEVLQPTPENKFDTEQYRYYAYGGIHPPFTMEYLLKTEGVNWENLLVISYKEIFDVDENAKYIALNKLEQFTNSSAGSNTKAMYDQYVANRNEFLKNHSDWFVED